MSFSLDLEKFAKKAGNNAAGVVKKTAMDMFGQITYRTPVDTGRARANWQVSFGYAASGTSLAKDDSGLSVNAPTSQKSAAFQSRQGAQILSWKEGDIWLSNNLPYISRLEYGWSKQAPGGMVRVTMREFQTYVNNAVRSEAK